MSGANLRYRLKDDVVYDEVEGVPKLFNPETGMFHELNETGAQIINTLTGQWKTLDEIADKISQIYEADESLRGAIKADVQKFLDDLLRRRLIDGQASEKETGKE